MSEENKAGEGRLQGTTSAGTLTRSVRAGQPTVVLSHPRELVGEEFDVQLLALTLSWL